MKHRPVALLSALTAMAFAVLVGLGWWQLERRQEKLALLAKIEARTSAAPISLADALLQWRRTGDAEYLHVTFRGRYLHGFERYMFGSLDGRPGWHVYTPVATGFQHVVFAPKLVFVNRGFVPAERLDPATRKAGQIEEPVVITGLVRQPPAAQATFDPDNQPAQNRWYWRDLKAMVGTLPPELRVKSPFLPFFVDAAATDVPGGLPQGGVTRLEQTNRHLEYAMTWFALAATLLGVYLAFVFPRRPADVPEASA